MGRRIHGGVLALVAAAALFFVYFLSSPDSRFEADDAYAYAAAVERADYRDMLNPYHPIHLPISKALFDGVSAVSDVGGLDFMVALGSLFAAVTVVLFYVTLKRWFGASVPQALFGAASLGASYLFWRYAGEAEVYAFASFAAVLLIWAAVSWTPRPATVVGIAALVVFALLAHTVNGALVLALPMILRGRGWDWKRLASASGVAIVLLGVTTVAIYQLETSTLGPPSEISFVEFYLGGDQQVTGSLDDLTLGAGVAGTVFVASNSLFVFGPTRSYLEQAFGNKAIADEIAMGESAPVWVGVLGVAAIALVAVAALVFVWRLARSSPDGDSLRVSIVPALLWCLAYIALVIAGRAVAQPEVWALFPVPFWALVTGLVTRKDVENWVLAAVPASLALATVLSGLLPLYTGEDRLAEEGGWFATGAQPGDLVLTADSAALARYIAYESDAHAAQVGDEKEDDRAVEMIERLGELLEDGAPTSDFVAFMATTGSLAGYHEISDADGRLFLTADMFDPPDWLMRVRPHAAAALVRLGVEHGALFQPVGTSGRALVRIADLGN